MITTLIEGMTISPTTVLTNFGVKSWRYGRECCDIAIPVAAGTPLKIKEVSRLPGDIWIKAALPESYPPRCLKISRDEYERWFKIV